MVRKLPERYTAQNHKTMRIKDLVLCIDKDNQFIPVIPLQLPPPADHTLTG
jgi:hypothetical protein